MISENLKSPCTWRLSKPAVRDMNSLQWSTAAFACSIMRQRWMCCARAGHIDAAAHRNMRKFIKENTTHISRAGRGGYPAPTLGFQRVIQRAIMHVSSGNSNKNTVTGANVLVAMYGEKDSHAVYFLQQQGVSRLDVVNYLSHGITKQQEEAPAEPAKAQQISDTDSKPDQQKSPLELYATDLNAEARRGRIDPLIGREHEVERVIQVLCRRRKNNPLLVGEAGVGKTAIAEGLAWRITKGDVPEILAHAEVYALDMGALLAGTKYRGRFRAAPQGRASSRSGQPQCHLFIDEIHTLIGAGSGVGR